MRQPVTSPLAWGARATVGVQVLLGLTCTVSGLIAMSSAKRPGHHPRLPLWRYLPPIAFWPFPLPSAYRSSSVRHGEICWPARRVARLVRIRYEQLVNGSLLKALVALVPAGMLLFGSATLFRAAPRPSTLLQLLGATGLILVVLTHICEALHLFPIMGWGSQNSPGHYLDLSSALCGFTLFPLGYLLYVLSHGKR